MYQTDPMLTRRDIADLRPGGQVMDYYLLKEASVRITKNGLPFLSATLSDCSGSIQAVQWEYGDDVTPEDVGSIVHVTGHVGSYNGQPQLTIVTIVSCRPEDCPFLDAIVPVVTDSSADAVKLEALIDSMDDPTLQRTCRTFWEDNKETLKKLPAAKSVHHAAIGGWLKHTSSMMQLADAVAGLYGDCINRDMLLTGAFFHDVGKISEFSLAATGLVSDYSVDGNLIGHAILSVDALRFYLNVNDEHYDEKARLLEHMLLSHHGQPEFGAAVVPKTAEAEALSYIDMLDSRMEIYAEALEGVEPGSFSENIWSLGKSVYKPNLPK